MDYKKANRAYLYMVISMLTYIILFSLWQSSGGGELPVILNNFFSEMTVLLPALAVVLFHGDKLSVLIPLKKIRVSSALLTIVYVVCLYPLVTLVNAISMLFVPNRVLEVAGDIVDMPFVLIFLSIGLFGPFVEEIIFRGILLQSYQRTGRIVGSIILSSVLFGMTHMNLNQFAYGAVMGIMLALLYEATGSVLTSFIAHAIFNSVEVVIMYATSETVAQAQDLMGGTDFKGIIFMAIGVYSVLALIFTVIALCIVYKISDIEGRAAFFKNITKTRGQGYKLITVPLVIAMVISIVYMSGVYYILYKYL